MRIIFLGPPGVGKGTVAKGIMEAYGIPQISTGELFRHEIATKTKLGITAAAYINEGKLVPDDITITILEKRVSHPDCKKGFILDGFPRTLPQAERLESAQNKIEAAVLLKARDSVVEERIEGRRMCTVCRHNYHIKYIPSKKEGICDICGNTLIKRLDDSPQAVKKRLFVYHEQTSPLIQFYKKKKILLEVNAEQPPREVLQETITVLKKKFGR